MLQTDHFPDYAAPPISSYSFLPLQYYIMFYLQVIPAGHRIKTIGLLLGAFRNFLSRALDKLISANSPDKSNRTGYSILSMQIC